jgi:hypothetical protein
MMGGLTKKHITLAFQLGQGNFGESGYNEVTISGLRCSATIQKSGSEGLNFMQLTVYGLTLSLMNQLSTLGKLRGSQVRNNVITVTAGDDESGMAVVFIGTIWEAWADLQGMPDSCLVVSASSGGLMANKPVPAISFTGTADVATIISGIATQAGFNFQNYGVTTKLSYPYFAGTALTQIERCAQAAGIHWIVDNDTVAIWPRGGSRGGAVPVVSPTTNLVGYPVYSQEGVSLTVKYTPDIIAGGLVDVQGSSITPANGTWYVLSTTHNLESEMPGGSWFTQLTCLAWGHVAE